MLHTLGVQSLQPLPAQLHVALPTCSGFSPSLSPAPHDAELAKRGPVGVGQGRGEGLSWAMLTGSCVNQQGGSCMVSGVRFSQLLRRPPGARRAAGDWLAPGNSSAPTRGMSTVAGF